MKKETLEEAIIRLTSDEDDVSKRLSGAYYITKGAKWKEQRSYSEEDMKEAFQVGFNVGYNDETSPSYLTFKKWFKQFKKK